MYDTEAMILHGGVETYLSYINGIPLLTDVQEYEYAEKWRLTQDLESAKKLVLSHLRLVASIARNYLGYGLPIADIIQEGTVGLMKAVKSFDARRNVRLVTFATHWIKAEINDFIIKNWRIVRTVTTKAHRKLFFKIRSLCNNTHTITAAEVKSIALALNVTETDVTEMHSRMTGTDTPLIGDDSDSGYNNSPIEWLSSETSCPSPEIAIARKEQYALHTTGIECALSHLDQRSRTIIEKRWLVDDTEKATLTQLACELNISAERVRQLQDKALITMRTVLQQYQYSLH